MRGVSGLSGALAILDRLPAPGRKSHTVFESLAQFLLRVENASPDGRVFFPKHQAHLDACSLLNFAKHERNALVERQRIERPREHVRKLIALKVIRWRARGRHRLSGQTHLHRTPTHSRSNLTVRSASRDGHQITAHGTFGAEALKHPREIDKHVVHQIFGQRLIANQSPRKGSYVGVVLRVQRYNCIVVATSGTPASVE